MSAQQYYQPSAPQQAYQPPGPGGPNGQQFYPFDQSQQNAPNEWSMKQSQPYANQSYPPPTDKPYGQGDAEYGGGNKFGDTAPYSQATEATGARFRPKSRLNDPIFLVLFIAAFAGWVALSVIALRTFVSLDGLGGGLGNSRQGQTGTNITLDR